MHDIFITVNNTMSQNCKQFVGYLLPLMCMALVLQVSCFITVTGWMTVRLPCRKVSQLLLTTSSNHQKNKQSHLVKIINRVVYSGQVHINFDQEVYRYHYSQ